MNVEHWKNVWPPLFQPKLLLYISQNVTLQFSTTHCTTIECWPLKECLATWISIQAAAAVSGLMSDWSEWFGSLNPRIIGYLWKVKVWKWKCERESVKVKGQTGLARWTPGLLGICEKWKCERESVKVKGQNGLARWTPGLLGICEKLKCENVKGKVWKWKVRMVWLVEPQDYWVSVKSESVKVKGRNGLGTWIVYFNNVKKSYFSATGSDSSSCQGLSSCQIKRSWCMTKMRMIRFATNKRPPHHHHHHYGILR